MNLEFITEYYIPIVLVACMVVGYCIKHISWLDAIGNEYIPAILAVLGALFACINASAISFSILVAGAVTGLASTGLHQTFKKIIDVLDLT